MTESTSDNAFEHVAQRVDPQCRLIRAWPLTGGVSAEVTALEIERQDSSAQKLLIRRHGPNDLALNPHIAADEFHLLQILHSAGLATPKPLYLDQSNELLPTPYVVIEYIEGETVTAPTHLDDFVTQLATHLASIHAIDHSGYDVSFLPDIGESVAKRLRGHPVRLDESLSEGHIRDALEAVWPPAQHNPSVLLHGDYWPGNMLWRDSQLVAIIDWEDAAIGDPLADLANGRFEILWAFGDEAMRRFTNQYISLTAVNCTNLPYWDLYAALRPASRLGTWGLDAATEQRMRRWHEVFVTQALEQLPAK